MYLLAEYSVTTWSGTASVACQDWSQSTLWIFFPRVSCKLFIPPSYCGQNGPGEASTDWTILLHSAMQYYGFASTSKKSRLITTGPLIPLAGFDNTFIYLKVGLCNSWKFPHKFIKTQTIPLRSAICLIMKMLFLCHYFARIILLSLTVWTL